MIQLWSTSITRYARRATLPASAGGYRLIKMSGSVNSIDKRKPSWYYTLHACISTLTLCRVATPSATSVGCFLTPSAMNMQDPLLFPPRQYTIKACSTRSYKASEDCEHGPIRSARVRHFEHRIQHPHKSHTGPLGRRDPRDNHARL